MSLKIITLNERSRKGGGGSTELHLGERRQWSPRITTESRSMSPLSTPSPSLRLGRWEGITKDHGESFKMIAISLSWRWGWCIHTCGRRWCIHTCRSMPIHCCVLRQGLIQSRRTSALLWSWGWLWTLAPPVIFLRVKLPRNFSKTLWFGHSRCIHELTLAEGAYTRHKNDWTSILFSMGFKSFYS